VRLSGHLERLEARIAPPPREPMSRGRWEVIQRELERLGLSEWREDWQQWRPADPRLLKRLLRERAGWDSNPNQRTQDLFEQRPYCIARLLPTEAFARPARRLIGPLDDELQVLATQGLTLREIGERVGMSAEGVRWRLRRATAAAD
jgi:hypothetical protein